MLITGLPATSAELTGVPRIVDGDTVEIAGTKVRLYGIDAPETDQLCLDAKGSRWACGVASRDQLEHHAGGKPWKCIITGADQYGRSLGTCRAGGEDVDKWMVRAGWALSFVRYSHAYDADEKLAREAGAGLWAGAFIAPWDWRARNGKTLVLRRPSCRPMLNKLLLGAASSGSAPARVA